MLIVLGFDCAHSRDPGSRSAKAAEDLFRRRFGMGNFVQNGDGRL